MTNMEEKIMNYICENPGARKREVASAIGVWFCDVDFLRAFSTLENDGVLRREDHRDLGNMEFYDKWYVVAP